jgi:uncharacterized repeat protein (TIGR01451 family)
MVTFLEDRSVPAFVDLSVAYNPQPPTTYVPGTSVSFTVVVSAATIFNTFSLGDATNANFTETLTGGTLNNERWVASYTGAATGPANGTGDINVGTLFLPTGSTATFTLVADVPANETAAITNTATVAAGPTDTEVNPPDNGPIQAVETSAPVVDLAVAYSTAPPTYTPGLPVTFAAVVTNAGPSDANLASYSQTLPAPATNVRWTASYSGGATGPASGTGDINIQNLLNVPSGGSVTFTMTADTPSSATSTIVSTATVTPHTSDTDSNTSNNGPVTAAANASPVANLQITNTVNPTSYAAGGTLTYTVIASNAGPSDVPGALVTDTFTGPVTGATWTVTFAGGAAGTTTSGTGDINTAVNLPAGGSATFTVTVTVSPTASGNVVSTASVAAPPGQPISPGLSPAPPIPDPNPANNTATVTTPPRKQPPLPVFVVGGDGAPNVAESAETVVASYDAAGNLVQALDPFGVVHGVRPATAPVTASGTIQVAAATGPGDPPQLVVVDSTSKQVLGSATPFPADYLGGMNVAVGSLDGATGADGNPSQFVVVGADGGGGPVVLVYRSSGGSLTEIMRFFAFDDPGFRGGVRVAVGSLGGGHDDLVVVSGPGGGPRVRVFDGLSLSQGKIVEKASFFAFDPAFRGGGYVAVGDLFGQGYGNIIFGAGAGGGPHVAVFDGKSFTPVLNFYNGDSTFSGGVRVAARDLNPIPDGRATLITGDGPGADPAKFGTPSQVRMYNAPAGSKTLPATPDVEFTPFPDFTGGVFVG